ncbi:MAG: hypothetical protein JO016_15850 [Actinobacteria bacterium]|nr:hypothetical protein [Actinomycetota bacterium]
MAEVRDTETTTRPRRRWRLLRGIGWLVFFLVVASVSYVVLVMGGH